MAAEHEDAAIQRREVVAQEMHPWLWGSAAVEELDSMNLDALRPYHGPRLVWIHLGAFQALI